LGIEIQLGERKNWLKHKAPMCERIKLYNSFSLFLSLSLFPSASDCVSFVEKTTMN
jgi:hypothetical protein